MTAPNHSAPAGNFVGGKETVEKKTDPAPKENFDAGSEPLRSHPEPRVNTGVQTTVSGKEQAKVNEETEFQNALVEKDVTAQAQKPQRKFAKQVSEGVQHDPTVQARVTKKGADKISTGRHEPQIGDEYYAQGEIITITKSNAEELEDRGFVEIQD